VTDPTEAITQAIRDHNWWLAGNLGVLGYPVREKSACGQPQPKTGIERTCEACGASFLGLAAGKTGERGLWVADWQWCCSAECASTQKEHSE